MVMGAEKVLAEMKLKELPLYIELCAAERFYVELIMLSIKINVKPTTPILYTVSI